MYRGKKVIVVMPAYQAEQTLRKTYDEVMAQGGVDQGIVVDDHSRDRTMEIAKTLPGTLVHRHDMNTGYGGNQKSCYRLALEQGGDIVIMVHPDYQYTPPAHPGHGLAHRQRALPLRAGIADPGRLCPQGRHAPVAVRGEPFPDPGGEPAHGCQALGVPHRV